LATRKDGHGRVDPTLGQVLASLGDRPGQALFLDLRPAESLPATALLNRFGFLVVPVIQRWVASPALLRCERLLGLLVEHGRQVARPSMPRGVAFLLDGERAGAPARPGRTTEPPRAFDNRYSYRVDRFPSASFLQLQEIRAVGWVSRTGLAADLQPYARQLLAAGLPTELVELYSAASVAGKA
jgi:hypothetical protein